MAVVFANMGLSTIFQDFCQGFGQCFVRLVWAHQAPRISVLSISLACFNIIVALCQYGIARSQRVAYERVVRLLGVRRLTAGFFDVGAGLGKGMAVQMKRITDAPAPKALQDKKDEPEGDINPTELDAIQAAMYVSQLYNEEQQQRQKLGLADGGSEASDA